MPDNSERALADQIFGREAKRERDTSDALKLEEARRAAVLENMHRLRRLRLSHHANSKGNTGG
jgi:hypothetical protein